MSVDSSSPQNAAVGPQGDIASAATEVQTSGNWLVVLTVWVRSCLWILVIKTCSVVSGLSNADFGHYLNAHNVGVVEGLLRVWSVNNHYLIAYTSGALICGGMLFGILFWRVVKPTYGRDFGIFLQYLRAFAGFIVLVTFVRIIFQPLPFGFDVRVIISIVVILCLIWGGLVFIMKKMRKQKNAG